MDKQDHLKNKFSIEKKQRERKKRETNFSIAEKSLLVDLVEARFSIIESKRTDAISVKHKNKEWEEIALDFNSQNINVIRTWSTLRNAWENLKKLIKKLITQENVNRVRTGGGPPVIFTNIRPEERPVYEKVRALLYPVAIGLHNKFDNDVLMSNGEYDMEGGHEVQDENSYQNEESIDGVQDENIYQNEESINGDWSSYSSAKLRTPRTKILGKFPICPVNNGHADVDIDQFICSQEDVEQICIIETNVDDSSPNTYVLEIPSQPVSSASDTTPRHKKPKTKVASESSSAFEISNKPSLKSLSSAKSTDKSPSTRHLSTSRRRPIISQTKNEEFADAKIKAPSAANEYAAEQHGIIMEIYKEKMKQESLATQIMEEKLKTLKRKNSVLPRSDEGDSS